MIRPGWLISSTKNFWTSAQSSKNST